MAEEKETSEAQGKKTDEKEMPFLDHLEEFRWRIVKSLVSIIIFSILSYIFIEYIFEILVAPYRDAMRIALGEKNLDPSDSTLRLIYLNPTGGFLIHIKLAVTAGLIFSLPVIIYQIWQFIAPGLLENERRFAPVLVLATIFCFSAGAAFCYYVVLQFGLGFLFSFQSPSLIPMISIDEYFGFVTALIIIFGIVFEMPVLAYFLTKIGLLTPEFLRQKRRYGIVAIFVAAAIITPSVDAFTQILLAAPLLLLYELSIWVSKVALPDEVKEAIGEPLAN